MSVLPPAHRGIFFYFSSPVLRNRHAPRDDCAKPPAGVDFGKLPTIIALLIEC
jgi:hypothetical protein